MKRSPTGRRTAINTIVEELEDHFLESVTGICSLTNIEINKNLHPRLLSKCKYAMDLFDLQTKHQVLLQSSIMNTIVDLII